MKRQNKKLTTLLLSGALCLATAGGFSAFNGNVDANAEVKTQTYKVSEVFHKSGADFVADGSSLVFNFKDQEKDGEVYLQRDLALKWYEGKGDVQYLTLKFALQDAALGNVKFTFESESAWATEEGKTINVLEFTTDNGVIKTAVNGEQATVDVAAKEELTLTLAQTEESKDGQFDVLLKGTKIGTFENVGANYADYNKKSEREDSTYPLSITSDSETKIVLSEINGQSFAVSTDANDNLIVTDNAAPVLVVNEDIDRFLLGTTVSFDYEKVDVLQNSGLKETKKYYQWNPADTEIKEKDFSSSVYFFQKVYYVNETTGEVSATAKDGFTATSVYAEDQAEYVSIQIKLEDKAHTEADAKTYDLAWYVTGEVAEKSVGEVKRDYILFDRYEEGPSYNFISFGQDENGVDINVVADELAGAVKGYEDEIKEVIEADKLYAGSNSNLSLPSLAWLIGDNNGYRSLSFTICYQSLSSDSGSVPNKEYNELKIPVEESGLYKFKVFATDKAGNAMEYYLDGEKVKVDASNVWKIEEIPEFQFSIENKGLKAKDETATSTTNRKDTEVLDTTYSFSSITIVGAKSLKNNTQLYKVDTQAYNNEVKDGSTTLTVDILAKVTYEKLRKETDLSKVEEGDYLELYRQTYAKLVADELQLASDSALRTTLLDCIKPIAPYNDLIDEELHADAWKESDNKYNWTEGSRSFDTAEEGIYLLITDYYEDELPNLRVGAYQLVKVNSTVDEIEGTNNWLKDNLLSVILFAVAGIMLILVIILLLIKPTDETLEDVDEKAKKAESKKAKKENKEDNE